MQERRSDGRDAEQILLNIRNRINNMVIARRKILAGTTSGCNSAARDASRQKSSIAHHLTGGILFIVLIVIADFLQHTFVFTNVNTTACEVIRMLHVSSLIIVLSHISIKSFPSFSFLIFNK